MVKYLVLASALSLPACVGAIDGVDLPATAANFEPGEPMAVSISPAAQAIRLAEDTTFSIQIDANSYNGDLALAIPSAPPSWDISFSEDVQSVTEGETVEILVTVSVPTNGEAGDQNINISLDAGDLALSVDAAVTVEDLLVVPIQNDTGVGTHVFPSMMVRQGTLVRFENIDGTRHTIHAANGEAGFPHQPAPGMDPSAAPGVTAGGNYDVTLTAAGNFQFYCHDHGPGRGMGALIAQELPIEE